MSLSYVHRYHAGHFADIHKHLALIAILMHLQKKTTPICVLDAFAGEGLYNLDSPESQKTGEYQTGLSYILKDTQPTPLLQAFLQISLRFLFYGVARKSSPQVHRKYCWISAYDK